MADDPNGAQSQLGLIGSSGGSMNPVGIPTPQQQVPYVKHPGEVSVDLVQTTQTQIQNTLQQAMITRPNAMNSMSVMGSGFGPMGSTNPVSPLGDYASQFKQNMGGINAGLFNPFQASFMSGGSGFNAGMLPGVAQMTPPAMGIYRPYPQAPVSSIPPMPYQPLFPTPFTPPLLAPQFSTAMEYGTGIAGQRIAQNTGFGMALPGTAARLGVDYAGTQLGAGLGAHFGARFGGVGGARFGSIAGAVGGLALSELGGFGHAAEGMMDNLLPFSRLAQRSAQMRGISQGMIVGGADLDVTGRGYNRVASAHLARGLEDLATNRQFRRETDERFNTQDLVRMTHSAGQAGMMNDVSSPEEVITRVRNIAKSLKTFMRVANEPDIREALKQMGQMNAMGLSLPETIQVMSNARMYSKMAGTSIKGIMESGLAGAATFQQHGLTAGLGMEVGMGSMAMARQLVGTGTMDPRQVALLGGINGMAQREMQMQAATLKMPMMAASMATIQPGGAFGISGQNVQSLLGGHVNVNDMAGMGAANLADAVRKHGPGALGMFQMQQSELQDQLGRVLGPMGMKMMQMRQVMNTQKMLGLEGPGGFVTAAQGMGMDPEQARQMAQQAASPRFFQDMRRQLHNQIQEQRGEAYEEFKRGGRNALDFAFGNDASGVRSALGRGRNFLRDIQEGVASSFFNSPEEEAAEKQGQILLRTPRSLLSTGDHEDRRIRGVDSRTIDRIMRMNAERETAATDTAPIWRNAEGEAVGANRLTGGMRSLLGGDHRNLSQYRQGGDFWDRHLGGGNLEAFGRVYAPYLGFKKDKEIEGELEQRSRSTEHLQLGLTSSVNGRTAAMKRLRGEATKKGLDLDAIKAEFETGLAEAATKSKGGTAQGQEMDVFNRVMKEHGASGADLNINDMMTVGATGARDMAGKPNEGFFAGQAAVNVVGVQAHIDAAAKHHDDTVSQLTGGRTDRQAKQAVRKLFEENEPDAGTLAAAMATKDPNILKAVAKDLSATRGGGEKGDAYVESLGPKASRILAEAGEELKPILADIGRRLASTTNKKGEHVSAARAGRAASREIAGNKASNMIYSGMQKLVKDPGMLKGVTDTRSLLRTISDALKDNQDLSGVVDDKMISLAKEYGAANTEEKQRAVEQKAAQYEESQGGEATGQTSLSGWKASGEKMLNKLMGGAAGLSDDVAKTFSGSVGTFDTAVDAFSDAVKMMGGRQGSTLFHSDVGQDH